MKTFICILVLSVANLFNAAPIGGSWSQWNNGGWPSYGGGDSGYSNIKYFKIIQQDNGKQPWQPVGGWNNSPETSSSTTTTPAAPQQQDQPPKPAPQPDQPPKPDMTPPQSSTPSTATPLQSITPSTTAPLHVKVIKLIHFNGGGAGWPSAGHGWPNGGSPGWSNGWSNGWN